MRQKENFTMLFMTQKKWQMLRMGEEKKHSVQVGGLMGLMAQSPSKDSPMDH